MLGREVCLKQAAFFFFFKEINKAKCVFLEYQKKKDIFCLQKKELIYDVFLSLTNLRKAVVLWYGMAWVLQTCYWSSYSGHPKSWVFLNKMNLGIPNMENNNLYFSTLIHLMSENLLSVVIITITFGQIFMCVCVTISRKQNKWKRNRYKNSNGLINHLKARFSATATEYLLTAIISPKAVWISLAPWGSTSWTVQ